MLKIGAMDESDDREEYMPAFLTGRAGLGLKACSKKQAWKNTRERLPKTHLV